MRYQRSIFTTGAAALALVAAVGFAAAQEPSAQHKAQELSKKPQATTQPMQRNTRAAASSKTTERVGETTTPQTAEKTKGMEHAQRSNRGKKTAKAHIRSHRRLATRKGEGRYAMHRGKARLAERKAMHHRHMATAQEQNRKLRGLQGNAATESGTTGRTVHLTTRERQRIRRTVIAAPNAPRAGHVGFGVRVGTVIPGGFNVVPLPPMLVRLDPAWNGFDYFVYRDEVVVVNPADMRIVAVLPA